MILLLDFLIIDRYLDIPLVFFIFFYNICHHQNYFRWMNIFSTSSSSSLITISLPIFSFKYFFNCIEDPINHTLSSFFLMLIPTKGLLFFFHHKMRRQYLNWLLFYTPLTLLQNTNHNYIISLFITIRAGNKSSQTRLSLTRLDKNWFSLKLNSNSTRTFSKLKLDSF